jgi:hypothetical protein
MNTRTGITGTKIHLYSTKVFWSEKKQMVIVKISGVNSECNRMTQNENKFNTFYAEYKSNPENCCKKCVERMLIIHDRAKQIHKSKQV